MKRILTLVTLAVSFNLTFVIFEILHSRAAEREFAFLETINNKFIDGNMIDYLERNHVKVINGQSTDFFMPDIESVRRFHENRQYALTENGNIVLSTVRGYCRCPNVELLKSILPSPKVSQVQAMAAGNVILLLLSFIWRPVSNSDPT